ncbi:MAG: AtpZ/AtpI family protein [Elusimicrobia bacterium]|nr:AtpZ/AtpI family protein [Elusimicrobiota bacterium]
MKNIYNFISAASFGFIFVLSIVVGLGIGIFLDKIFKTHPVFTVIFTAIGMVSGIYSVFKEIRIFQKKQ